MKRPTRQLLRVGAILLALSLWQWYDQGEVDWHQRALALIGDRERNSGLQVATRQVEALGSERERPPGHFDLSGRVVRVADGDTLSLLDASNQQHRLRLYGIDAPEREQPHGERAAKALAQRVANRHIDAVIVDTDDYGRKVATVYLDGENLNLWLVEQGHAWWYRYHARHEHRLEAAEQTARSGERGLWAGNQPEAPWDWRRSQRFP